MNSQDKLLAIRAVSLALAVTSTGCVMALITIKEREVELQMSIKAMEERYVQVPNPVGYKGSTLWVKSDGE